MPRRTVVSCLLLALVSPVIASGSAAVNAATVGGQFEVLARPEIEQTEARFGSQTAMSGDGLTMAVAANFFDAGANFNVGMVRTYVRNGNTWSALPQDFTGGVTNEELGHSLALSEDGSYLAIASKRVTVNSVTGFGQVKVYKRVGSTWERFGAALTGTNSAHIFGNEIALSSDGMTLAVATATNHAAVYRHNATSGNYEQLGSNITTTSSVAKIDISDDGNSIIVGQEGYDDGADTDAGMAQTYTFANGSWSQRGADIVGLDAGDRLGFAVQMSGDGTTIAVSAIEFDGNVSNAGRVTVYRLNSNAWSQIGSPVTGQVANENQGAELALSADGSTLATRSSTFVVNTVNVGAVRVYTIGSSTVTQKGSDIYGDHNVSSFGSSIAVDRKGESFVIGQPSYIPGHANGNTTNAGNATVIGVLRSTDASLSGISLSSGTVSLVAGTISYRVSVANSKKTLRVIATPTSTQSSVTINDSAALPGGNVITLKPGKNSITIKVTADAGNSETYSLTVTREPVRLKIRKSITMKSVMASIDKTIPKGAKVRVTVSRTSRTKCTATASQVRALGKTGTCRLSVSVTPKATAKNRNPRAVKSTVTVTVYR